MMSLFLWSCYQFNNPVDPHSPSYQGFPSASGWLDGWGFRKVLVLKNTSGQMCNNYGVKIVAHYGSGTDSEEHVYLNSHSRTDFGDARFTDSDGETELDYWVMQKSDGENAVFWVEIPSLQGSGDTVLYCYYGNPSAVSQSNGSNTLLLFDDFAGGTFDPVRWRGDTALWLITDGVAQCSTYPSTICGYDSYEDVECITRVKFQSQTDGFMGVRGNYVGNTDVQTSRYELFFDSENTPGTVHLSLRSIDGGTINDQSSEDTLSPYDHDFFIACLGVGGSTLYAKASCSGDTVSLVKENPSPSHSEGYISFGTKYTASSSMYVDWIAVRPIVSPEPTYVGWGDEEQL